MYICDTGAAAGLLTKVVMEININEAFAGKDIGAMKRYQSVMDLIPFGVSGFRCQNMLIYFKSV